MLREGHGGDTNAPGRSGRQSDSAIRRRTGSGRRSRLQSAGSRSRDLSGGASCESKTNTSTSSAFEVSSKRRKGFPSESRVKRGDRVVRGNKELLEKLGRNDLCPCGSRRRFQTLLHAGW